MGNTGSTRGDRRPRLGWTPTSTGAALKATERSEFEAVTRALNTAKSAVGADDESCRSALEAVAAQLETLRRQIAQALGDELDCPPGSPAASGGPASKPAGTYAKLLS